MHAKGNIYPICWKSFVIVQLHSYYCLWETIQEDICPFTSQEFMHPLCMNSWVESCVPVLQTLLMLTTHDFIIHRCMRECMLIINVYSLSMNWFDVHTLIACNFLFLLSGTFFFLTQLCLYISTLMFIFASEKVGILFKWQVYACLHHIHIFT